MTSLRIALCAGLALALASPAAAPAQAPASVSLPEIEPEAVQALTRMSAYLGTLTAFEIRADTSLDLVTEDGQKLTVDGVNHYLVRRPDSFVIEVATAKKVRKLVYDGKQLSLAAPKLGYYATVAAPPTIRQTLDAASDRYGLEIPLEDLFRWTDPSRQDGRQFASATVVGPSLVEGTSCDQYAFRQGEIDWQIWIKTGDRPTPCKVVIVDRRDPALPQYEARLTWNTAPTLTANSFTFRPELGAAQIKLAAVNP